MIYADNAATTKLDEEAYQAMIPYLCEKYGNPSQPYLFSRETKKALKESREIIADVICADPSEIYFTSGGTESDNWAIKSNCKLHENKNEVITSHIEHHAILNSCNSLKQFGEKIKLLDVNEYGIVSEEKLSKAITDNTRLVSIMLANNEIGTIEPIKNLCEIAHECGIPFHTDAVQAVGHIDINVKTLGVDLLSASGHKFNGPRGIGFLYIRKGTSISPYFDGGAQEFGMRAGTENVPAIVAMAVALKRNNAQLKEYLIKMEQLENVFLNTLSKLNVSFIRNGINQLPGNVNISIKNAEGEMLMHRLDLMGICVSTGSACDSKSTQLSHVIKAIKVPQNYAEGTLRISFGKYNTSQDAVDIAKAIAKIVR